MSAKSLILEKRKKQTKDIELCKKLKIDDEFQLKVYLEVQISEQGDM